MSVKLDSNHKENSKTDRCPFSVWQNVFLEKRSINLSQADSDVHNIYSCYCYDSIVVALFQGFMALLSRVPF